MCNFKFPAHSANQLVYRLNSNSRPPVALRSSLRFRETHGCSRNFSASHGEFVPLETTCQREFVILCVVQNAGRRLLILHKLRPVTLCADNRRLKLRSPVNEYNKATNITERKHTVFFFLFVFRLNAYFTRESTRKRSLRRKRNCRAISVRRSSAKRNAGISDFSLTRTRQTFRASTSF